MKRITLLSFVLLLTSVIPSFAATPDPMLPVVDAIRTEALRPNNDPIGKPLPLFARWNNALYLGEKKGYEPNSPYHPDRILEAIEQGHYVLPYFQLIPNGWAWASEEKAIKRFAQLRLPINITTGQPEMGLCQPPYVNLPPELSPCVVKLDGTRENRLSPFGSTPLWRDVAQKWITEPWIWEPKRPQTLEQWYPNPPLVLWSFNNEAGKLAWTEVENEKRYMDLYGAGRSNEFKRAIVAQGWIERYSALRDGIRSGLSPTWANKSVITGYNAFIGYEIFRWWGWGDYALSVPGKFLDPNPLIWEGGSPDYYAYDWNGSSDHTVWGPQVGSMSYVFALREALRINPNFWWELSTWDGSYTKRQHYEREDQKPYTPNRYQGFMQFGLWLNRPRVLREFQFQEVSASVAQTYSLKLMDAVDRVHTTPLLRRFWRRGALVPHPTQGHPWQDSVPAQFANRKRWFMLDCDINPPYPWSGTENYGLDIPVFAIAYRLGVTPNREWLIIAYSPRGNRSGVTLKLPGYGSVKADIKVEGSMYHVVEGQGVKPVLYGQQPVQ